MLSKEKRLNLKKDFTWVAAGEKSGNLFIKIFFRFGNNQSPRVGIATSKNTFKKAVDRNRSKRLVSSGFEVFYRQLVDGVNIIALPKEEVLRAGSEEIINSLGDLLGKLKLLKNVEDHIN